MHAARPARFRIGQRVRVCRAGLHFDVVGVIIQVDATTLIPHYLVRFASPPRGSAEAARFPEYDLTVEHCPA